MQKFSRHHDVRVVQVYDDNREDLAGQVARLVAGDLRANPPGAGDTATPAPDGPRAEGAAPAVV